MKVGLPGRYRKYPTAQGALVGLLSPGGFSEAVEAAVLRSDDDAAGGDCE